MVDISRAFTLYTAGSVCLIKCLTVSLGTLLMRQCMTREVSVACTDAPPGDRPAAADRITRSQVCAYRRYVPLNDHANNCTTGPAMINANHSTLL